jgi:DNA-binding HxlR family transcriptional regulator
VATSERHPSAIGQALLALGDQWTLLMLQRAFLTRTRRFAGWRDELGMSESVLAGRLKEMVAGDLLRPSPYREESRGRTEYLLTERALELWPMLVVIWAWEYEWIHRTDMPVLIHDACGDCAGVDFGCSACGVAPVTARETEAERGQSATFDQVAVPRHHRRTVRDRVPRDPLSHYPETLELLGDRWSTAILAASFLRIRRFADLQEELGVAPSILADRLRRFTELKVLRPVDGPAGRREYRLTAKGLAFFGVFAFLVEWAQRWYTGPPDSMLLITHQGCGGPLVPFLRCRSCHEHLTRTGIHFDSHDGAVRILPPTG